MKCFTDSECAAWLMAKGFEMADREPVVADGYEICFQMPAEARTQRMLARDLAAWLGEGESTLLWLKDWRFHKPDEMALLAGLRRGHDERRPLSEASGHLFDLAEKDELTAWIGLAMSFCWDGFLYTPAFPQDRLQFTHEELLCLTTSSPERFAAVRRLAQRYEADIYRETESP
jgi:hypothetical protein